MIIFLYGPDDYRREAKKREILAEFEKKRSGFGVGRFDLESDGELERLGGFLASQSLFQSAKMAVLDSAFESEPKELKRILQEVLEHKNITVLLSEKDKPVKALDFLRKEPILAQEFEFLEGQEWEGFILREVKRSGVKVTPTALKFLASVYQKNTWSLVTELEKIRHLGSPLTSSGSSVEIDTRDLEELGVEQAPVFWSLIMGFKSRSLPDRLRALEKVLGSKESSAKIFNILAYQLPDKLQDLARYDLMVKSGKLEYDEVLVDLTLR